VLVDFGRGKNRLAARSWRRSTRPGRCLPRPRRSGAAEEFLRALQELGRSLAYHDRSDGGLFATVSEMASPGIAAVTLNMDSISFDPAADDVDAFKRGDDEQLAARQDLVLPALFCEELGAVLQIRASDRPRVMQTLRDAGLGECSHLIGQLNPRDEIRITRNGKQLYSNKRDHVQRTWSETTWRMQRCATIRTCAREEFDASSIPRTRGSRASDFSRERYCPATGVRPASQFFASRA